MKKVVIVLITIIVIGVGYWLASPLFIDKRVSEDSPLVTSPSSQSSENTPITTHKGNFSGFDSLHTGSGDVSVIKTGEGTVLRFEENFQVSNGPDLYVGFGKDGEYKKGSEVAALKGNIGSQNYLLPQNFNLEGYNEVWIWCRAFSVPFAKAGLTPI